MTPEQVIALARSALGFADAAPAQLEVLTGGHLNHVWRVAIADRSCIVKHAPPFVAGAPEIPLSPERIDFEARALRFLESHEATRGLHLRPVLPLRYHPEHAALVLEDLGPVSDLGTSWLRDPEGFSSACQQFGTFLGTLHRSTLGSDHLAAEFNNRDVQQTRAHVQYRRVAEILREHDHEAAAQTALNLGQEFLTPGSCLIMGDAWPASILLSEQGPRIIDWEFCHFGSPAQDVGHFIAHLRLMALSASTKADTEASGSQSCPAARIHAAEAVFLGAYEGAVGTDHRSPWTQAAKRQSREHCACEILFRAFGAFPVPWLNADDGGLLRKRALIEATRLQGERSEV